MPPSSIPQWHKDESCPAMFLVAMCLTKHECPVQSLIYFVDLASPLAFGLMTVLKDTLGRMEGRCAPLSHRDHA